MRLALIVAAIAITLVLSTDEAGTAGHRAFDAMLAATPLDAQLSDEDREQLSWLMQKTVHVVLFSILGILAGRTEGGTAISLLILLAVTAEGLQVLTSSRSADWRDAMINLICSAAGYLSSRKRLQRG